MSIRHWTNFCVLSKQHVTITATSSNSLAPRPVRTTFRAWPKPTWPLHSPPPWGHCDWAVGPFDHLAKSWRPGAPARIFGKLGWTWKDYIYCTWLYIPTYTKIYQLYQVKVMLCVLSLWILVIFGPIFGYNLLPEKKSQKLLNRSSFDLDHPLRFHSAGAVYQDGCRLRKKPCGWGVWKKGEKDGGFLVGFSNGYNMVKNQQNTAKQRDLAGYCNVLHRLNSFQWVQFQRSMQCIASKLSMAMLCCVRPILPWILTQKEALCCYVAQGFQSVW